MSNNQEPELESLSSLLTVSKRPMSIADLEAYRKNKVDAIDDGEKRNETIMRGYEDEIADLERLEMDSINTIPEVNFVHVFIPYFAGDAVNPYNVDLSNWLTISGGPYRPVNIVDAKGVFLYQVPAIINQNTLSPKEHSAQNAMFELMSNANQLTSISPRQGQAYFKTHLAKVHNALVDKTIDLASIRQWNEIFKRYKRPLIVIPGLEAELEITTPSNSVEKIDFSTADYEPL